MAEEYDEEVGSMIWELNTAVTFLVNLVAIRQPSLPISQVKIFGNKVRDLMVRKYKGHWYVKQPSRGQAYRCIRINEQNPVDSMLEEAASSVGISYNQLMLPAELTLWVDPKEVSYRLTEWTETCKTLGFLPAYNDHKYKTTFDNSIQSRNQQRFTIPDNSSSIETIYSFLNPEVITSTNLHNCPNDSMCATGYYIQQVQQIVEFTHQTQVLAANTPNVLLFPPQILQLPGHILSFPNQFVQVSGRVIRISECVIQVTGEMVPVPKGAEIPSPTVTSDAVSTFPNGVTTNPPSMEPIIEQSVLDTGNSQQVLLTPGGFAQGHVTIPLEIPIPIEMPYTINIPITIPNVPINGTYLDFYHQGSYIPQAAASIPPTAYPMQAPFQTQTPEHTQGAFPTQAQRSPHSNYRSRAPFHPPQLSPSYVPFSSEVPLRPQHYYPPPNYQPRQVFYAPRHFYSPQNPYAPQNRAAPRTTNPTQRHSASRPTNVTHRPQQFYQPHFQQYRPQHYRQHQNTPQQDRPQQYRPQQKFHYRRQYQSKFQKRNNYQKNFSYEKDP